MKTYNKQISISFILICLIFVGSSCTDSSSESERISDPCTQFNCIHGAVVRGDSTQKELALIFSGDSFADGGNHIQSVLRDHKIKGSFFFTGNFYRNPDFEAIIKNLHSEGHYLGAHSDQHLLYNDWENRDSLLVTFDEFSEDVINNYKEMEQFGISKEDAHYYLPPYEWYNKTIAEWTDSLDFQLINMTHSTLSHADYTTPDMPNYRSSDVIYNSILEYESSNPNGLNGFMLLIHIGTDPKRTDKFYLRLDELINELKSRGYEFVRVNELLEEISL